MISAVSKHKKIENQIGFFRTLTGNLTGNLFADDCRWDFIFSSDRKLNLEQDERLKRLQKPRTI